MWFLLSLGSAFFNSLRDLFSKRSVVYVDEYTAAWAQRLFALPFLIPLMVIFFPPVIDRQFWFALAVAAVVNTITSIWYMKALKYSSLSLVAPITSLTPVMIMLFSKLITGELPSLLGVAGIVLTAVGVYLLHIQSSPAGFTAPLRALFHDRGALLMLGVTVLWGVVSVYDKIGVVSSNAFFYTAVVNLVYTITLFPFVLAKHGLGNGFLKNSLHLIPIGVVQGLAVLLQMMAIPFIFVSYVVAVKHTSGLLGVVWGKYLFGEQHIKERLAGAVVILLGVILLLFS